VNLVDELFAIVGALHETQVPYAVCGGIAVTIHGATRTTKDIDLLVDPEDVERAVDAIRPLGYTFRALPMTFAKGTEREQRVQRVSKLMGEEVLVVDLILAGGDTLGYLRSAIEVDTPDGLVRVVGRGALVAMKRAAGRPQDLADIERLESDESP